jgi:FKBP-type peptidyl-prolyl cis-trans isomerase
MRRSLKRLLSAVLTAGLAACNLDVAQTPDLPTDPTTETFAPGLKVDLSKMQKTTAGVYYQDLRVGTGASLTPAVGTSVVVSYAGYLKNGFAFAQALNLLVTMNGLPPGLPDGMSGMHEGGERLIVVPSELGYRNVPVPGVPPNSTLVYDVILSQLP